MSLQERISAQSKLDTNLLLQNDRISKASRRQENKVLTFNQVDEELLREYNEQFPTSFEYVDETTGEKKFRKYLLPDDVELDEPELNYIFSEDELDNIIESEINIIGNIKLVKDKIKQSKDDMTVLQDKINDGSIDLTIGRQEMNKLDEKFSELKAKLNQFEDEILKLNDLKSTNNQKIIENQALSSQASQQNKKKINKYKEELNILNSRAFTTEQLPSETEEEYYQRLRDNAQITEPEENLQNAKQMTLDSFKDKLKEIVRNQAKLEQISNTIDSFGEVDNKLKLFKKWELFKSRFLKIFGSNNTFVTVDDIVEFINEFISTDGSLNYDEEQEIVSGLSKKDKISELTNALMMKYKTAKEMRERLKNYNVDNYNGENDLFQNIKTTVRHDIAKQVARKIIINNKTNDIVGFGIKTEEIPEKVAFGKLVILLKKLYYKNILAVKHHNMISIVGFKNTKVSDKLVKILMGMVEGTHPQVFELNALSINEKQLYDRLIQLAGLNKMIPNTQDKTVSDLKLRMELIEGQLNAGNNSPLLLQELYVIVHSLKDFGVLSQKDIKNYLSQF